MSVHDVKMTLRSDGPLCMRLIEQGIPIHPIDPAEVENLRLLDKDSQVVPASIEPDGRNEHGQTVWVRVAAQIEAGGNKERKLTLSSRPELAPAAPSLNLDTGPGRIAVGNGSYKLTLTDPGHIRLETGRATLLDGNVGFQLWPDARSIIGGGAATVRLADFVARGWSVEEQSESRCLILLRGRVPRLATYDAGSIDEVAAFDCELELICYSFSPVIRFRWRIVNSTVFEAHLERYALSLPLAGGSSVEGGERSDDGKFLRHVSVSTPGGKLTMTAGFVDSLGAGAGIDVERRESLGEISAEEVLAAGDGVFEPHRWLAAEADDGRGLDLVQGGINPPRDGDTHGLVPDVHRLFYLHAGRTFEGSLLVDCNDRQTAAELDPIYFELEPDYYSSVGALPENGDPVYFGAFEDKVFRAAEWMLKNQWKGTLWWGEWWREWDVARKEGAESVANGNSALAPLYHYWRTGDARFAECAKRAMEFVHDIQLCKRRGGTGPFFHSRRFLFDKIEWVHMRYQRIEGSVKAGHFFGDRRLRQRALDAAMSFARYVHPNGAPGHGEPVTGKRRPAGPDTLNFRETLVICWRETGKQEFLELAKKMGNWELRFMKDWDWEARPSNSYHWHFVMRGMLALVKATGDKRFRDLFLEEARKNMELSPLGRDLKSRPSGMSDIGFVEWMNWLVVEAEKMSGETWLLDALRRNTEAALAQQRPDGASGDVQPRPASKFPAFWIRYYPTTTGVAYIPVMTARRKALGLPD